MDCKITAHSLRHEMLLAVFLHHLRIHCGWGFSWQGNHKSPCKLGVPLLLYFLGCVPKCCSVSISGWGIGGQHDLCVNHLFLVKVVFHLLVILGKQLLSGLVGSSGNGRAALASLDDADFQMWYRHLWLNLLSMVQKRPILFSTVGRGIFTCCRGMIACNRSSAASPQRGSGQSQRRGSVASSG